MDRIEGEPLMGESEPDEHQSPESEGEAHRPASHGEPIVSGVVKIDFNDDEAVNELSAELAAHIMGKVRESGISPGNGGEVRVVSVGGVPYAEYQEEQDALQAEYQAILSFLPSRDGLEEAGFLAIVDAYIHRKLSNGGEAWLHEIVELVQAALDWGEVDASAVDIYDADEVWAMVTTEFTSYEDVEVGEIIIAALDFGRGVTYVCADTHSERYVYDYEIQGEIAPNDRVALRGYGFDG